MIQYNQDKGKKGGEKMEEYNGMTNAQLDSLLETIAKRIEAEAKTPEQAAEIVREAKTNK